MFALGALALLAGRRTVPAVAPPGRGARPARHDRGGPVTDRALVLGGGGFTGVSWMWGCCLASPNAASISAPPTWSSAPPPGPWLGRRWRPGSPSTSASPRSCGRWRTRSRSPCRARRWCDSSCRCSAATRRPPGGGSGGWRSRRRRCPEEQRLRLTGDRLQVTEWPDRALTVTAADAETGEFVAFDRTSGVPLRGCVRALRGAGVWPPISANGRRYVDGGLRSPANADLAAGYARVVVLAPITGASVRSSGSTGR